MLSPQKVPCSIYSESASVRIQPSSMTHGLTFAYYPGEFSTCPEFSSLEPFSTGKLSHVSIQPFTERTLFNPNSKVNSYALLLKATLTLDEECTLILGSNDGSLLYLDGIKVMDNDDIHYYSEMKSKVQKGSYSLVIKFFHSNSSKRFEGMREGVSLILDWIKEDGIRDRVPSSCFQSAPLSNHRGIVRQSSSLSLIGAESRIRFAHFQLLVLFMKAASSEQCANKWSVGALWDKLENEDIEAWPMLIKDVLDS